MIGHYVHHHGRGHLQRALTLSSALRQEVTGLSSLPRPRGWEGPWIQLARDDTDPESTHRDPTANGRLHWVPRHDAGLLERQGQISAWLREARPEALVVDQSVEVSVLARLHGVPVIAFTAPGRRGDDAHSLGFETAAALVGPWPGTFSGDLLPGVAPETVARFAGIGAVSRFPSAIRRPRHPGRPRVLLLSGEGGDTFTRAALEQMQRSTRHWQWDVLSRSLGSWVNDPLPVLQQADVVITHAGQNAIAEVATCRVPAIVVPQERPFDEQEVTARALAARMPVLVVRTVEAVDWSAVLDHVRGFDGSGWETWSDGQARLRMQELVDDVLERTR